jgi:hypothetical protein
MVDPLDDEQRNVADTCLLLLQAARDTREQLHRHGTLLADWSKDSSLETWFPLTAEEFTRTKTALASLQEANSRLSAELMEARKGNGAVEEMIEGMIRNMGVLHKALTIAAERCGKAPSFFLEVAASQLTPPTEEQ